MGRVYEGFLDGRGLKFGIVVSRYNEIFTRKLLEGALDALRRHNVAEEDMDIVWVPGAFEIPLMAKKMAASGRYQAVICLGAIIRSATPHFEYVASENAKGIAQAALETGVPVLYGVLTTDTIEQAIERSGSRVGNRGWEAAVSALEMANLVRVWEQEGKT